MHPAIAKELASERVEQLRYDARGPSGSRGRSRQAGPGIPRGWLWGLARLATRLRGGVAPFEPHRTEKEVAR